MSGPRNQDEKQTAATPPTETAEIAGTMTFSYEQIVAMAEKEEEKPITRNPSPEIMARLLA